MESGNLFFWQQFTTPRLRSTANATHEGCTSCQNSFSPRSSPPGKMRLPWHHRSRKSHNGFQPDTRIGILPATICTILSLATAIWWCWGGHLFGWATISTISPTTNLGSLSLTPSVNLPPATLGLNATCSSVKNLTVLCNFKQSWKVENIPSHCFLSLRKHGLPCL